MSLSQMDQLAPYTRCYCEENVYALLHRLAKDEQRTQHAPHVSKTNNYAIFISNLDRTALLFQQQASNKGEHEGHYVLWDYHVITVSVTIDDITSDRRAVVIDPDSKLPSPAPLQEYVLETFRPWLFETVVPERFNCRFRVVKGDAFLLNFASDRSHMLAGPDGNAVSDTAAGQSPNVYIHTPPSHLPIQGPAARARGETNNLWAKYLDMRLDDELDGLGRAESECYGVVVAGVDELLGYPW
ncbi:Protein N-terminal glutamine amidohydrolase [Microbotryomycetes sp. JL221]|nr:Protein N-terminal glutamine amidohydrolase [Microbotryomycetes sp. JL221]